MECVEDIDSKSGLQSKSLLLYYDSLASISQLILLSYRNLSYWQSFQYDRILL